MRDKSSVHSGVVLVVGLAMALAVYLGLSQIAAGLHTIPTSMSSSYPTPPPTAVALTPTHIAVVHDWGLETFSVDAGGHIQKTDQFDPHFPKPGQVNNPPMNAGAPSP